MTTISPSNLMVTGGEVVRELRQQGLSYSEICRLCNLPGRTQSLRTMEAGTATQVRKETVDALQAGYQRFLDGDRSYVVRRGTRPGLMPAEEVLPPSPRQPVLLNPESRLVQRLRARKEAA